MNITGMPIYIDPSCWFDVLGFDLITIEANVVISANVFILVHDHSLSRARDALAGKYVFPEIAIARGVRIKRNSFIGLGAILMPGAEVGENCIVGAGSVVRGKVQDGVIVSGNPARILGDTLEWGRAKLQKIGIKY
ncbi:acyltransferase [Thermodesulfobacteriota bacterium]